MTYPDAVRAALEAFAKLADMTPIMTGRGADTRHRTPADSEPFDFYSRITWGMVRAAKAALSLPPVARNGTALVPFPPTELMAATLRCRLFLSYKANLEITDEKLLAALHFTLEEAMSRLRAQSMSAMAVDDVGLVKELREAAVYYSALSPEKFWEFGAKMIHYLRTSADMIAALTAAFPNSTGIFVPREPTLEMVQAALDVKDTGDLWEDMASCIRAANTAATKT